VNEVEPEVSTQGEAPRTRSDVKRVAQFVAVAYAISWAFTLPLLLGQDGLGVLSYSVPPAAFFVLIVLHTYGPFAAALICSTGTERRGLFNAFRRKVAWVDAVLCVAGPPTALLIGIAIVGGRSSLAPLIGDPASTLVTFAVNLPVLLVLGGPLGEVAGWRGFALPRLQGAMGAARASLLLGLVWAGWHLPNFFIPEAGTWQGSLLAYLGIVTMLSFVHTSAYNATRGSLAVVTVLHAAIDSASRTFLTPAFGEDRAGGTAALLIGCAVLFAVVGSRGFGPRASSAG
jgi:membrane protease YdiL (CAAX protease family)